ncbi:MAG: hypothetical protein LRZ85_02665 [Alphaproteobacteria bacterium]|nr:hypothetical protein [Alphaproteobacteria bacterium]MCD8519760.1 hypothetical protein [Alphaproteobacteria bacterium]
MKTLLKLLGPLFGLFWMVFGLNGFLHFFSTPEPSTAGAEFSQVLQNTGYVMPLVYGTQVIAGTLLLLRRFIPLALLFLGPIVLNIILYDVFLNPAGLGIGIVLSAIYAALLAIHKEKFLAFLKP